MIFFYRVARSGGGEDLCGLRLRGSAAPPWVGAMSPTEILCRRPSCVFSGGYSGGQDIKNLSCLIPGKAERLSVCLLPALWPIERPLFLKPRLVWLGEHISHQQVKMFSLAPRRENDLRLYQGSGQEVDIAY